MPIAFWAQFDEANNLIHFYDPDSQTWSDGTPGSFMVLSSRFAELHLAQTSVQGSGPNGRSVNITWSIVFKEAAVMNNYKQFLLITDDYGFNTGFDKVGSWSVSRYAAVYAASLGRAYEIHHASTLEGAYPVHP